MKRPLPEGEFLRHEPCPHCGSSDAYSVYSSGTAFCFACNTYDGDASDMPEDVRSYRESRATGSLIEVEDFIPLTKRKITTDTVRKYGYGVGLYHSGRVQIAPYYSNRALVAQHLRMPNKDFAWVGEAGKVELFGQQLWKPGKRLVITEGEIDCMSIAQCLDLRWAVVSLPSGITRAPKDIARQLEWIESFDEVILAFDDDKPGQEGVAKVAPLLTPGKVRIMRYDGLKDANELLVSRGSAAVVTAYWNAQPWRPDGIINGKDIWSILESEPPKGFDILYPGLSDILQGIRKGELYLFTAGSGIGKSTAVNEIAYHLMMEHGLRIGVIALEENVRRTANRYIGIRLNKPVHMTREGISPDDYRAAYEATVGNGRFYLYDHFGSMNLDVLLSKVRYMAVAEGVDFIVLDHISIVVSGLDSGEIGEGERKMLDILMTNLRSLVEETGVGVLAVVHLKRTGKNYNEGATVSLTDLRGSASLEQFSDAVIALERDQQGEEPNKATIRVLKNRWVGTTGTADTLLYSVETGRLLPYDMAAFTSF